MLLIDGVKYELWTPSTEDEFEQVVKEHAEDIFGGKSIYIDRKQKLKSLSGIGSIPDGYAVIFGDSPHWHIVEVELSSHPLHEHIVSQVSRFINGIRNPSTQREIAGAIYAEILGNDFIKLKVKKATEPTEIYKFLLDLISKPPILTIIIEKDTQGLREAISTLAHPQIKVVEFQTFTREGVGLSVHAHLFEPLYQAPPKKVAITETSKEEITALKKIELIVWPATRGRLNISKTDRSFFPDYGEPFTIVTDIGEFRTLLYKQKDEKDHFHLEKWSKAHPELKVGDKVTLEAIEPKRKYHLEIIKQEKEGGWRPIRLSP